MTISLRQSIALLLGVSLLLTLLIGGVGSYLVFRHSNEIEAQYEQIVKPAVYIGEIKSNYWRIHSALLRAILSGDQTRTGNSRETICQLLEANEQWVQRYKAAYTPNRLKFEKFLLLEEKRQRYLDALDMAIELSTEPDRSTAIREFAGFNAGVLLPAFNDFMSSVEELAGFVAQETDSAAARNAETLVTAIAVVWLIILIVITVLLVNGFFIARRVTRVSDRITRFAAAISEGDFNRKIDPEVLERNDEFGIMARALDKMKISLAQTIGQLNSTAETLTVSGDHKSAFLARISHESRNQLNAILGMTYRGKKSRDLAVVQDSMDKIASSSTQLLALINDILDISKIESGKFGLMAEEFNFEKILMSVCTVISMKTGERAQKFNVSLQDRLPAYFVGDSLRLSQVLTNLLGNACKFTPDNGSISLKVECRDAPDDAEFSLVSFTVEDTGIGMTDRQMARLFTPFEQPAPGNPSAYVSGGLGLAICEKMVRLMGGNITVKSRLGFGSSFTVNVKLKNSARTEQQQLNSGINPELLQVLLVSPDERDHAFFSAQLGKLQVPLVCVREYSEASALLDADSRHYDAIFIEWPGNNYKDRQYLLEKATSPEHAGTLIAISSSAGHGEAEAEARRAGISRFIQKPLFPSLIMDVLNRLSAAKSQENATTAPEASFPGKRLLLVEDIDINREIVTTYLENTGIEIVEAVNGEQAVEKYLADHSAYDLIFMDVQMPVMDGYAATSRIREEEAEHGWPPVVIVAMTANTFREDIENCQKAGMNAHLGKPMSQEATMTILKNYLGTS
ncbi:response regulator [Desulfovibrio sp. OttesenSCG-928-C06]|nr:response regulator [Desulfovibrio sp. OttesenSCG-928-C06]